LPEIAMLPLMSFDLPLSALAALLGILAIAGLVSGLSGFGFSAVGAAILALLPPSKGVPLLMALSTANQLLSLGHLRGEMTPISQWWPHGPAPYLAGGMLGVPWGLWLLHQVSSSALLVCFGALLFATAVFSLLRPARWHVSAGGWITRGLVGFAGGLIGGFTAMPGALVVVWLNLAGISKTAARATTQPYILGMQIAALALLALVRPESFDRQFMGLFAVGLPVVLPFTLAGVAIYRRMSDRNFRQATLMLLAIAGIGLFGKAIAM
jgi:uncharacterized protein